MQGISPSTCSEEAGDNYQGYTASQDGISDECVHDEEVC